MEYSSQRELLEDKCARNYDKYYDVVHRDIFADVDLDRFAEEIENANDNYTTEILKQLHDKFVEIYDTDSVDGLVGFIQVPAIVESLQTGDYDPSATEIEIIQLDKSQNNRKHIFICINTDFMESVTKENDEYIIRVQTYYMESASDDCVYEIHISKDFSITFFGLDP